MAIAVSGAAPLAALTLVGAIVFGLWACHRTASGLGKVVEGGCLCVLAMGMVFLLGELVFRLPPVVALTGGGPARELAWARSNYDRLWERNALRIRSFHVGEPRSPGQVRILALGDSFTWGDGIARTEDTWPYVLERFLRARGVEAIVFNLADRGYTTVNEAEVLSSVGWWLEPDLVVVQFFLNDSLPSGPGLRREGGDWWFRTWPLAPGLEKLAEQSYLYSYLDDRFRRAQIAWFYPQGYAPLFEEGFAGWQACKEAFREMARETGRRRIPFFVVLFPKFEPGPLDETSYRHLAVHDKVGSFLRGIGVQVVDLLPVYARFGKHGEQWWASPSNPHPGVEAHRVAGEAIGEALQSEEPIRARGADRTRSSGRGPAATGTPGFERARGEIPSEQAPQRVGHPR
jgi:lysophospholipase L1-like esterase